MFSRAAKSIVQPLSRRSYHVAKGNFKTAVGSIGEVANSKAQFPQQTKLNSSTAQEIMPFKNLKFKNITLNSAEGETLSGVGARAAEGTTAEGNIHAIDLLQLRGLGPIFSNINSTSGFYKNLQNVRNNIYTTAKRNFGTLQPTFCNNDKFVNNACRSYSKCSGEKGGCDAPPNPCSKSKASTRPDPNQRVISPCKSSAPCTPTPKKCDRPKCPPPCPPPAAKCPPTCFPPAKNCPGATPKCPPPCPPPPCDPCPKPCKPPKCPPRCPLDPPPPCPPSPPPPKCPEPQTPNRCCGKPEPPASPAPKPKCPKPCSGPTPAPHPPTPRESCSAPKRSCEVPLEKMLQQSRKKSPPAQTACCPPATPPPPRSICCPTPPKETCCPSPKPMMPSCVPPEKIPKPCAEQKAPCPPPTPTCLPPEPAPPCRPREPPCPPAEPPPCGCTPAPQVKGYKKKATRQSFWKKLTRKMSTHSGNRGILKARQPRFKVPTRRFGITLFNLVASGGAKCKTGKDICAELDPACKRLCKKKPATRCSLAEKASCAERMRIAKKAREAEDERSQKRPLKCPTCLPPERCQPPIVPPASEKIEYPVTVCAEAPPCPSYQDKVDVEPVVVCPPPPQLPKPPSAPVVLCPCPPPPKLPPGPCPCLDSAKEVKLLVPIYLPPCARKPKYTCERKVYSCTLQRDCDKRACPRDDESHLS